MASFTNKKQEQLISLNKAEQHRGHTLEELESYEEYFRKPSTAILGDSFLRTPTADSGLASPNYLDSPSTGAVGTRYVQKRLHSYLPSGKSGPETCQTFIVVSSNPASHDPVDIDAVRMKNLISPAFSPGKSHAAETDENLRGFQLALYPAKSGGGVGQALVADTDHGPIAPNADPNSATGFGADNFWTVDYESGIVRLSCAPNENLFNPNGVYSDIEGLQTQDDAYGEDGYGALTLFSTFYHYTGENAIPDNLSFVTVGDGVISEGIYSGTDYATVEAAIASIAEGGTVFIKNGNYTYTDTVTIPENINIVGINGANITKPTDKAAFEITGSNTTVEKLNILCPNTSTSRAAIELKGTSVSQLVKNINIKDNTIQVAQDCYGVAFTADYDDIMYHKVEISGNYFTSIGDTTNYISEISGDGYCNLEGIVIERNTFERKIIEGEYDEYALLIDGKVVDYIDTLIFSKNQASVGSDITAYGTNIKIHLRNVTEYVYGLIISDNRWFNELHLNKITGAFLSNNFFNLVEIEETLRVGITGNRIAGGLSITRMIDRLSLVGNSIGSVNVQGIANLTSYKAPILSFSGTSDGYAIIGQGNWEKNIGGILGVGAGTNSGVYGLGGGTSGNGGLFYGGDPNGIGAYGIGSGTGYGVYGLGGGFDGYGIVGMGRSSDADNTMSTTDIGGIGVMGIGGHKDCDGVVGIGSGAGKGVYGFGGSDGSLSAGVYGHGGNATNGTGVKGVGTGSRYGGHFVSGSSGYAVLADASGSSNGIAVYGQGGSAAPGGQFLGGAGGNGITSYGNGAGDGIEGNGGDTGGHGGAFYGGLGGGYGMYARGNEDSGTAGYFQGGASDGYGIISLAGPTAANDSSSGGIGIYTRGTGGMYGIYAQGGAKGGTAGYFQGGASDGYGVIALAGPGQQGNTGIGILAKGSNEGPGVYGEGGALGPGVIGQGGSGSTDYTCTGVTGIGGANGRQFGVYGKPGGGISTSTAGVVGEGTSTAFGVWGIADKSSDGYGVVATGGMMSVCNESSGAGIALVLDTFENALIDGTTKNVSYCARFRNKGGVQTNGGIVIEAGENDAGGTTTFLSCRSGDGVETVGYIEQNSGTFQLVSDSDIKIKKNIKETSINGLETINNIKLFEFDKIYNNTHHRIGFIAQDLQQVFPEAVSENENKLFVAKEALIPLLVKATQELSKEVDDLKVKNTYLEEEINKLKNK